MRFSELLKTSNGEFEVNRVVGAIGTMAYIVGAHIFIGYDVFVQNRPFDVTAYCLAFPGGLGVAVASIAGAVAIKDRGVATARIITDTGSVPSPNPSPTERINP